MTSAPIQSEFSPDNPVASVPSDQDLTACLEIAAWIGQDSSDDYLHSFTTIFIALLHADNSLSKWFLRYARAAEVKLEAIYATRQFRPAQVAAIREHRARNEIPSGKPAWTRSATDIIENAQRLMGRTSSTTLGCATSWAPTCSRSRQGTRNKWWSGDSTNSAPPPRLSGR